jgi:hypothetical protein
MLLVLLGRGGEGQEADQPRAICATPGTAGQWMVRGCATQAGPDGQQGGGRKSGEAAACPGRLLAQRAASRLRRQAARAARMARSTAATAPRRDLLLVQIPAGQAHAARAGTDQIRLSITRHPMCQLSAKPVTLAGKAQTGPVRGCAASGSAGSPAPGSKDRLAVDPGLCLRRTRPVRCRQCMGAPCPLRPERRFHGLGTALETGRPAGAEDLGAEWGGMCHDGCGAAVT